MPTLAFLTQHDKARAVAPALQAAGFTLQVDAGFDTDQLGTFTGEQARPGTQLDAALKKAQLAAQRAGVALGLGSEGSFGPDPYLGMTPWGVEVLAYWDNEQGYAVHASVQGPETNYAQTEAATLADALMFAERIGFPEHGLVVGRPGEAHFAKELRSLGDLQAHLQTCLAQGPVWLETDMRAHRNPTRMAMIERTAQALAERLSTPCPQCQRPGYGVQGLRKGALCASCGLPTQAARAKLWQCKACGHETEEALRSEVPAQQCQHCNP